MKKLALLTVLFAVAGGASAQTKAKPTEKVPAKINCAVTKDKVDVAKATKDHMFADYKGRRYFFCCEGCPATFKKDPAKYTKTAPSIATPPSGKK